MSSSSQSKTTIYTGTFVHTPTPSKLSFLREHSIGVSPEGVIIFIVPNESLPKTLAEHNLNEDSIRYITAPCKAIPETSTPPSQPSASTSSKPPSQPSDSTSSTSFKENSITTFFTPGHIDTHPHAPQYPNTGIFGTSTLLHWLQTYTFPLESSFTSLSLAKTVYNRVVARGLANGTTCAAYHATTHVAATNLLADICKAKGQRALVGRVCMDRECPSDYRDGSVEEAERDSEACVRYCRAIDPQGVLVRPIVTPRFAVTCSDAALRAMGSVAKRNDAWIQTHMSENHSEIAKVAELFPTSKNYAGVYDDTGLLGEKTLLAHCVHLSEGEVVLLREQRAKVSHCPSSNTCLTSGAARVKYLMRSGVEVSLGTDMSGGFSPSVLEMVRQALMVSRHVAMHETDEKACEEAKLSIAEALYLATRGGANCVGLGDKVGAFEVGMEWDAQLINLGEDVDSPSSSTSALGGVNPSSEQGGGGGHSSEEGRPQGGLEEPSEQQDERGIDEETSTLRENPIEVFSWLTWPDRLAKWIYAGDDRNIAGVWVRGRMVYKSQGVFREEWMRG